MMRTFKREAASIWLQVATVSAFVELAPWQSSPAIAIHVFVGVMTLLAIAATHEAWVEHRWTQPPRNSDIDETLH